MLGPRETKMIVLAYKVEGTGFQGLFSVFQVPGILVGMRLRSSGKFGKHLRNTTEEVKLLCQNLVVVGVILQPGKRVEWDHKVDEEKGLAMNAIGIEEWAGKYPELFEENSEYGNSEMLKKLMVCQRNYIEHKVRKHSLC